MQYDSYTNDSDVQFANRADNSNRGLTTSSYASDYTASEAALSMMPLQMSVAELMGAQSRVQAASALLRREVIDDNAAKKEADEFDGFSKRLSEEIIPGDFEHNAGVMESLTIDYGGNTKAMDALSKFGAAQDNRIKAIGFKTTKKKIEAEDRALDFDLKHQEDIEAANIIQIGNSLNQAKILQSQLEANKKAADDQVYGSLSSVAGSVYKMNPKISRKAASLSVMLRDKKDSDTVRTLTSIVGAFGNSSFIESAYSDELALSAPVLKSIEERTGLNLSAAKTEEEYASMLEAAKEKIKGDPKIDVGAVNLALEAHGRYMGSKILRDTFEEKIAAHLDSAPEDMSTPEGTKWRAGLAELEMDAFHVSGNVGKQQKDMEDRTSRRDKALELQKRILSIKEKDQKIKLDAEDQTLQKMKMEMDQANVARSEQIQILMKAVGVGKGDTGEIEKVLDTMEAQMKVIDKKTPAAGGTSIFR